MYRYTPDRPQRMAQMLAMQERNQSLNAPAGQRDGMPAMRPSLAYAGATPNTASGMPPQAMNFNGPRMTRQPGIAPQLGQRPRRVSPAGINTPQGGADRGDFDYGG
jgi:hypothetical protein